MDGVNDYSVADFGHTYAQDGLYNVEHIAVNSYGCSDTIVKQITVYALPEAVFSVDAVCEDTTTTFTNASLVNPVDNRSEEHTSELQSRPHLVCRLLLEKKNDLTEY